MFTDAGNTVYEVWVDSIYQTLTIDGGEMYGLAGMRRRAAVRLHAKPQAKAHAPKRKTQAIKKMQTVK